MKKIFTLYLIVFSLCNSAYAQGSGYCLAEKPFNGQISLEVKKTLGKKEYVVDYSINMCYTGNEELVVKINRVFHQKENELIGKKLEKTQAKLWADNITLNGDKEFHFKVEPGNLVEENFTYVVEPNKNTEWINKTIVITHQFRFEAEGISEKGEITCAMPIPDGTTIEQIVAAPETVIVEKVVPKPTPKPMEYIQETIPEERTGQTYNCIDSVRFYYQKAMDLYRALRQNQIPEQQLTQANIRYEKTHEMFEYFASSCENPKTADYKNQFTMIDSQISKIFMGQPARAANYGTQGQDQQYNTEENGNPENEGKSGFKLKRGMAKNPMRYLLGGFMGIVIIGFFIFKFGKKYTKKVSGKKNIKKRF